MTESITLSRTVGQRGRKTFKGFVRSSDEDWLCVASSRTGDTYVAVSQSDVLDVRSADADGPVTVSIRPAAVVYDVTERARPATDMEPAPGDEPGVVFNIINPWNQLALLEKLRALGGSLVIGDVDEATVDEIISVLERWKRRQELFPR